jgi:hypothetical protein
MQPAVALLELLTHDRPGAAPFRRLGQRELSQDALIDRKVPIHPAGVE